MNRTPCSCSCQCSQNNLMQARGRCSSSLCMYVYQEKRAATTTTTTYNSNNPHFKLTNQMMRSKVNICPIISFNKGILKVDNHPTFIVIKKIEIDRFVYVYASDPFNHSHTLHPHPVRDEQCARDDPNMECYFTHSRALCLIGENPPP